jgi:hypothetical protein
MKTAWTDHVTVRPLQRQLADSQQQQQQHQTHQSEMTAHWTRSMRRSSSMSKSTSSSSGRSVRAQQHQQHQQGFASTEELGDELQQIRRMKHALASQVAEMEREVAQTRVNRDITQQDTRLSMLALKSKLRKLQNAALHGELNNTLAAELGCATREHTRALAFESQLWANLCSSIQRAHQIETGRTLSGLSLAEGERRELEECLGRLREDVRIARQRWRDLMDQKPLADARAAQVAEAEARVNAKKDALNEAMLRCAAVQARTECARDATTELSRSQRVLLNERTATSAEFVHLQSRTSEVIRERARDKFVLRFMEGTGGEGGHKGGGAGVVPGATSVRPLRQTSETHATAALAAVGQVLVPTVDYASQGRELLAMLSRDAERLAPQAGPLIATLQEELRRLQGQVDVAVEQEQRMNQVLVTYVQDQLSMSSS